MIYLHIVSIWQSILLLFYLFNVEDTELGLCKAKQQKPKLVTPDCGFKLNSQSRIFLGNYLHF